MRILAATKCSVSRMDLVARLEAAGFSQVASQNPRFFMVHRGSVLCLIEAATNQPGSPMLMTEQGFATLLVQNERFILTGRGFEVAATDEQVKEIRSFLDDLNKVLQ